MIRFLLLFSLVVFGFSASAQTYLYNYTGAMRAFTLSGTTSNVLNNTYWYPAPWSGSGVPFYFQGVGLSTNGIAGYPGTAVPGSFASYSLKDGGSIQIRSTSGGMYLLRSGSDVLVRDQAGTANIQFGTWTPPPPSGYTVDWTVGQTGCGSNFIGKVLLASWPTVYAGTNVTMTTVPMGHYGTMDIPRDPSVPVIYTEKMFNGAAGYGGSVISLSIPSALSNATMKTVALVGGNWFSYYNQGNLQPTYTGDGVILNASISRRYDPPGPANANMNLDYPWYWWSSVGPTASGVINPLNMDCSTLTNSVSSRDSSTGRTISSGLTTNTLYTGSATSGTNSQVGTNLVMQGLTGGLGTSTAPLANQSGSTSGVTGNPAQDVSNGQSLGNIDAKLSDISSGIGVLTNLLAPPSGFSTSLTAGSNAAAAAASGAGSSFDGHFTGNQDGSKLPGSMSGGTLSVSGSLPSSGVAFGRVKGGSDHSVVHQVNPFLNSSNPKLQTFKSAVSNIMAAVIYIAFFVFLVWNYHRFYRTVFNQGSAISPQYLGGIQIFGWKMPKAVEHLGDAAIALALMGGVYALYSATISALFGVVISGGFLTTVSGYLSQDVGGWTLSNLFATITGVLPISTLVSQLGAAVVVYSTTETLALRVSWFMSAIGLTGRR